MMPAPPEAGRLLPGPANAWVRYGGIFVSVACLAGVVLWATKQEPPDIPSDGSSLAQLGLAVGAYSVAMALRGERWLHLLRRDGGRVSRGDAFALTVVGYMGNNVLPARGGDAIRVYLAKPRASGSYREIIGTLLAERILDAAFLLGLFVFLGYFLLDGIDVPDATPLLAVAGALLLMLAVVAAIAGFARERPGVQRIALFTAPILAATRDLRGGLGAQMIALTAAIWGFEAATYWAAGAASGVDMPALEALYIVALASIFVLIPSGPGYVGTLDAALIFGAKAVGASSSAALSFLVLLRFVLLVPVTVVGLVLVFLRYGGWRSLHPARPSEIA